ncbi:hypothetical protein [Actinoplanes xinjiangensis]|uniref:Uncharacterized protein n=1 Tax=Actinoplanes xinjiangensis TaxID=512350 RepID=A0A316ER63_9ACTN|nr:hypothetical protein BC793_126103 [Actinoplanes xinjiangensis]GIF43307.1 hypothetical protein Axi01nite_76180 [Actinoplanes xinjiangensis]
MTEQPQPIAPASAPASAPAEPVARDPRPAAPRRRFGLFRKKSVAVPPASAGKAAPGDPAVTTTSAAAEKAAPGDPAVTTASAAAAKAAPGEPAVTTASATAEKAAPGHSATATASATVEEAAPGHPSAATASATAEKAAEPLTRTTKAEGSTGSGQFRDIGQSVVDGVPAGPLKPDEVAAKKPRKTLPTSRPPGVPADPWTVFARTQDQQPGRIRRGLRAGLRGFIHEYALMVYTACLLAVAMTWPALRYPLHTLPQDLGDPSRQAWQVSWVGHILITDPVRLWQANAYFPAADGLAFGDSLLGYALAGMIGTGPAAAVLRYNILFVLAHALLVIGAYALVRQLGARRTGAAVAAVAFAYAPWRLAQEGHLDIISAGGIPLALAMLARGHGYSLRHGFRAERRNALWASCGWLVAIWQLTLGFSLGIPFAYVLGLLLIALMFASAIHALRGFLRYRRERRDRREVATLTAPVPGAAPAPALGKDAAPAPGKDTAPATGKKAAAASGETATSKDTAPGPGKEAATATGGDTAPAAGKETAPGPGKEAATATRGHSSPAAGKDTTLPPGKEAAGPTGGDTAPAIGKEAVPGAGRDAALVVGSNADLVAGKKDAAPTPAKTVAAPAPAKKDAGSAPAKKDAADPQAKDVVPAAGKKDTVVQPAVAPARMDVLESPPRKQSWLRFFRRPVPVRRTPRWKPLVGVLLTNVNIMGATIFAATGILIAVPYLRVDDSGSRLQEIDFFSPPLQGLLIGPAESRVWGAAHETPRSTLGWAAEMSLLPGFVLYALALAGLFLSIWRFRHRLVLLTGLAVAIILTLGTTFFDGRWTYLPLFGHFPASFDLRIPGRLMLWVTLLLAILAAGAVDDFVRRAEHLAAQRIPPWPGPWLRLATLVPLFLVALEGWNTTAHPIVPPQPAAMRTVSGPMLVLPTAELTDQTVQLWSTTKFQDMANGGGGFGAQAQSELRAKVAGFPDATSIDYLDSIGVRRVLLLSDHIAGTSWENAGDLPVDNLDIRREDVPGAVVFYLN